MTTIAWDGATLCGDKRSSNSYSVSTVTKIFRLKNGLGLVGFCGKSDHIPTILQWCEDGFIPCDYPEFQKIEETGSTFLHIEPDGSIMRFNTTPIGYLIEDGFAAIGSGMDFALSAMYLGASAKQAIEIATHFNPSTGNGYTELRLNDKTGTY